MARVAWRSISSAGERGGGTQERLGSGEVGAPDDFTRHRTDHDPSWQKGRGPRKALRTSIKSHFWKISSTFGDKCPQNGSKNGQTAPRTGTGCPHEGPSVVRDNATPRTRTYRARCSGVRLSPIFGGNVTVSRYTPKARKVDIRLPGKGNSNSRRARPFY